MDEWESTLPILIYLQLTGDHLNFFHSDFRIELESVEMNAFWRNVMEMLQKILNLTAVNFRI